MADNYSTPQEIAVLVANVNKAVGGLRVAYAGDVHIARRFLQAEVRKLSYALEEPNTEVWPRFFQINVSIAVEIVSDLGLWHKFEGGRSVSVADIVKETSADETIIIRVFRQLIAANLFTESPGPKYTITTLGKPYLNSDHRALHNFAFQDLLPTLMAMPRALAENGYKAPTKETGTLFKWVHGVDMWTWMSSHPDRAKQFGLGMRSLNVGNVCGDAYPWGVELKKLNLKYMDVAIVDIAGGQGHIMEAIRKHNPKIKGRFIVQDLPATFKTLSSSPEGIEYMPYDMFTPQPIKDAHIYYYRHIIHDWSDDECARIFAQLVPLLKAQPKSRLLLVDMVLPNLNASMQDAIKDLSMFPIGGMERTESQWRVFLGKSGLGIKKIWRGSEADACVECELLGAASFDESLPSGKVVRMAANFQQFRAIPLLMAVLMLVLGLVWQSNVV